MSTRDDVHLTDRERAVLAGLEQMAAIEDPRLARRLRGSNRLRSISRLRPILFRLWPGWGAGPVIVVGLALMMLSLSTMWMLGVVGALIAAGGLRMVADAVKNRWGQRDRP